MTAQLTFVLDAQEHDDFGVGEGAAEIVGNFHAKIGEPKWHERARANEGNGGAHFYERMDIGAGDATEEDIAKDDDLAALE